MDLKQSRMIVVSTSSTLVKVAQVSRAGLIEKIARQSVDKNGADAALRKILPGFDVKRSGVICVVPGDIATAKHIEVPSTDNDEIESILSLQAARHTPFSKDEILVSYIKIGSPRPNFTRVLLVVVKREAVKERLLFLKAAGLSMSTVVFVPEAVARFYGQSLKAKKGDAPVALLDVNMQSATFIVHNQGVPLMSRVIPLGIEHLAIDTEAPKQIIDEIKASLEAYAQEKIDRAPSKILVTVNHMALGGLPAAITEALGVPVEVLPYTTFVKGGKAIQEQLAKDFADDSALDVIAAGVTVARCQAELIPQEIRDQRSVAEKGRETLKAGTFILATLFFVGLGLLSKVYFKDQFLKQNLLEKYSAQRTEVKNLESMIARTRTMRQYLEDRTVPLEAIRELYRLVPSEIYLSGVSMDDAGTLSIQGVSQSMSRVFNLVTALEDSPLFENVKTKSTSTKKDRGKDVAAFEITMKLSTGSADNVPPVAATAAQTAR